MSRLALCLLLWGTAAFGDYMDHFVIREDVGLHKAPSIGPAKVLVIPVEVAGYPPLDLPGLQHFFSGDDPAGFVAYYGAASLGRYSPEVTLAPVVRYASCPLPLR